MLSPDSPPSSKIRHAAHTSGGGSTRIACLRHTAWVALLLLFSACAPAVTFQQLQPGRFQFGKDPVFALGSVELTPHVDVIQKPDHGLFQKVLRAADNHILKPEAIRADLEANMAAAVSRSRFAAYSQEDAGYFVTLSGTFTAKDTSQVKTTERQGENKKTETITAIEVQRNYRLDLSYSILNRQRTVVGKGRHASTDLVVQTGNSGREAAEACGDWVDKSRLMTLDAVTGIVEEILPHYLTVKRELKKGSAPLLKEGLEQALAGDLARAGELWTGLLPHADELPPADRIALYHNLGVYFEFKDSLEESARAFAACVLAGGDELCTEGLNRMRGRQWQLEQLKRSGL